MSDITIDLSQLKTLARDLKRLEPEVSKEFLKGLNVAGEIVATQARQNASFSTRIPGSIKVRRRGLRVRVQAGGDSAPEAAPLENRGQSGTFRHPVFGNREVWVDQPAHPFLQPAAEEKQAEGIEAIVGLIDTACRRLGL